MERSDDKDHKLVTVSSSEVGSPIEKDGSISPFSSREEFISENVAPPAPDGGRRAWLVVLGGWLNFTASFGMTFLDNSLAKKIILVANQFSQVSSTHLEHSSRSMRQICT